MLGYAFDCYYYHDVLGCIKRCFVFKDTWNNIFWWAINSNDLLSNKESMNEYMRKRMDDILAGRPIKTKEKKPIAKVSAKRQAKIDKEKLERGDDDTELQKWFRARMKQMGEKCYECGNKVENKVYKYAIHSICHILAKRDTMCPSVKYHPANWITLCPDHHTKFDNSNWEEIEQWGCWDTIRDRLIHVYDALEPSERRHFPSSVLKFIEENDITHDKH